MNTDLRRDLTAIILEEVYGYKEEVARRIAVTGITTDPTALGTAEQIISRFEARCSLVEG